MIAPILHSEEARLAQLRALDVLDSSPEDEFDALVASARDLLDIPIVLVSLVEKDRQWFKAKIGVEVCETSRDIGFCPHAILEAEPMIIPDALLDSRFKENPLVTGPLGVRFYAGAQLVINDQPVGTLCCIDTKPRMFSPQQISGLKGLARQVVSLLKARLMNEKLAESERRFATFLNHAPVVAYLKDSEGRLRYVNDRFQAMFGVSPEYALGHTTDRWLPEEAYAKSRETDRLVFETGQSIEVEQTISFADGYSKIYRIMKFPFGSDEERMLGGVVLDVTDSRIIEAKVRQQAIEVQHQNELLSEKSSELSDALAFAKQLESVSRTAAARFEHLFSGLPIACYTYDAEGVIQEWNFSAERLWGIPAPQAIFNPVAGTAVSKKNEATFRRLAKLTFQGKMTADFEQEEECNGNNRWLLTNHIPLWNSAGQVVGGLCANVDVTESRLTTIELTRIKAGLTEAQAIAKLGSWEFHLSSGKSYWSEEFYRIFDIPIESEASLEAILGRIHEEDREHAKEIIVNGFAALEDYELNHRIILTNGEVRHIHAVAHVLKDEQRIVGTAQDVTERKKMEDALFESELRFRTALYSLHEGLVVQGKDGNIILSNIRAGDILGLTQDQLMGRTSLDHRWRAIKEGGSDYPGVEHPAILALREGTEQHNCIMGVHKPTGELTWVSINAVPLFMEGEEKPYAAVVTFSDITERRAFEKQIEDQLSQIQTYAFQLETQKKELEFANVKLQSLASTDGLTGLSNHRTFKEELDAQLLLARRKKGQLSLILLDVDKFKSFNDDFGHQAGDAVLRNLASVLKEVSRSSELIARYGGEEFAILLPGATPEGAILAAERFRSSVEAAEWPDRPVTSSFGITSFHPSMDSDEMVRTADEALYMSKHGGRNRVTHYLSKDNPGSGTTFQRAS